MTHLTGIRSVTPAYVPGRLQVLNRNFLVHSWSGFAYAARWAPLKVVPVNPLAFSAGAWNLLLRKECNRSDGLRVRKTLNKELPYDSEISLFGVYPKEQ